MRTALTLLKVVTNCPKRQLKPFPPSPQGVLLLPKGGHGQRPRQACPLGYFPAHGWVAAVPRQCRPVGERGQKRRFRDASAVHHIYITEDIGRLTPAFRRKDKGKGPAVLPGPSPSIDSPNWTGAALSPSPISAGASGRARCDRRSCRPPPAYPRCYTAAGYSYKL